MSPQKQSRLYTIREHARAEIAIAKEEIDMAISHPIFVASHTGLHIDIEDLLLKISEYEAITECIDKHFTN